MKVNANMKIDYEGKATEEKLYDAYDCRAIPFVQTSKRPF
jgi:hypothetical protein